MAFFWHFRDTLPQSCLIAAPKREIQFSTIIFHSFQRMSPKPSRFRKCLNTTRTWLILEGHKVLLWLKVYCEVEHAVRSGEVNKCYFLKKEKPYKWIADFISVSTMFQVHRSRSKSADHTSEQTHLLTFTSLFYQTPVTLLNQQPHVISFFSFLILKWSSRML